MLEKLLLNGRVAVVTGGGGGLGTAISIALAEAGADVVVSDFRPEEGEKTAARVASLGRKSAFIPADITKSEDVNQMIARSINQWGHVDILVNCAGVVRDELPKALWEVTDRDWQASINTNLSGTFYCSRAVSRHMVERKWGRIINVASGYGLRGRKGIFGYNAAKAGVIMLTMSLALTLARDGIRVNVICPGLFETWHAKERYQTAAPYIPIGRVGQPPEIAPLVVYLASEASDYANGEVFPVDGGALASGFAPTAFAPVIPIK